LDLGRAFNLSKATFKNDEVYAVKVPGRRKFALAYTLEPDAKLYYSGNVKFSEQTEKGKQKRQRKRTSSKKEGSKAAGKKSKMAGEEVEVRMQPVDEEEINPLEFFPNGIHEDPSGINAEASYLTLVQQMTQERKVYDKEKLALLRRAGGQWTSFVNGKCLGTFETREEAADVGYHEAESSGRRAVFITQIGMEQERPKDLVLIQEDIAVSTQGSRPFIGRAVIQDKRSMRVDIVKQDVIVDTGAKVGALCAPGRIPNIVSGQSSLDPVDVFVKLHAGGDAHEVSLSISQIHGNAVALIGMPVIEKYDLKLPRVITGNLGSLSKPQ
jgi:hypothetical protein